MTTKTPTIFYFSASGNSLALAKDIAKKLQGNVVAIPSVMDKNSIKPESDVIGIVFPVYYASNGYGVPLIVERFVNKLEDLNQKYVFAVCTHSGMPSETIEKLQKLIKARGGELAGGFELEMGSKQMPEEKQQKFLVNQKKKAEIVSEYVVAQKSGTYETRGIIRKIAFALPLYLLMKPIFSRRYRNLSNIKQHLPFMELVPFADRSYQCDETKCNGCGVCAMFCPVGNIKMVENRPEWQHHCETCYGCYLWCPNEAIHGKIVEYNDRRHHPDVKLSELMKHKKRV